MAFTATAALVLPPVRRELPEIAPWAVEAVEAAGLTREGLEPQAVQADFAGALAAVAVGALPQVVQAVLVVTAALSCGPIKSGGS